MLTKLFTFCISLLTVCASYATTHPFRLNASLSVKVPGNPAVSYELRKNEAGNGRYSMEPGKSLPIHISGQINETDNKIRIKVSVTADEDTYFKYSQNISTGYIHSNCQFLMPGFWYRRNLLSPKEAPSFHTSSGWTVREDRLSTPLTGIYNEKSGMYMTVTRIDLPEYDALTTHKEGEVIVSGRTSLGYTGFEEINGNANLSFGYPFQETPKSYIRKLTLAPAIEAFQEIKKGETINLEWEVFMGQAADYSDFVKQVWEYSYDTYQPKPLDARYSFTPEKMKQTIVSYFADSFVSDKELKFSSGAHLMVATCKKNGIAEVGFIGRVLLNAFNAYEYGELNGRSDLVNNSNSVFLSYLEYGFTKNGFFREYVDQDAGKETDVFSIRRQSEGIYAMFHYLQYEKEKGRKHPEWEARIKTILDRILRLQNEDGSFPRKFKDDFSVVDKSGSSTPSATLPLVMAYKYFGDVKYLKSAKKTAEYLKTELIDKADYFSSTLDANCEDKEASLYAASATYYLALISKGEKRQYYAGLCRKAAYFTLSWYYMWDVPFAKGQMLGDIGLKTRGWGNVSVENNHIDVFIFEFGSVLDWLSIEFEEPRFGNFIKVIRSSMGQLLPYEGHMCGIAKTGYYPEVVQHTNWDYGKNGKGFYNDIFAPGWVVASLWELMSPGRAEEFLLKGK